MSIPISFTVEEAAEFRTKIKRLILEGKKHFELDFSNCTFIDSTGLGVLVSSYKKCMEKNGSFILHSVNDSQVMRIFQLTRLDKVFEIK